MARIKITFTVNCRTCGGEITYNKGERVRRFCNATCMGKYRHSTPEAFWQRVEKTNYCWLWAGKPNEQGYGYLSYQNKFYRAHRLAWELTKGGIPKGLQVLHRCDNPPCVNPDHLFLGTSLDNNRDRAQKNRSATGPRSGRHTKPENFHNLALLNRNGGGNAKLTAQTVQAVRAQAASGLSNKEIAARFHLNRSHVWQIVTRRVWKYD